MIYVFNDQYKFCQSNLYKSSSIFEIHDATLLNISYIIYEHRL